MKRDEKQVCKRSSFVKLLSGAMTLAVLSAALAADSAGTFSDTAAFATAFNSRYRTVETAEAASFLSRFRSSDNSACLPKFRSDIAYGMVIFVR